MSLFLKAGEMRSSAQGFFGDLAFRFRLFFGHERVIAALNEAESCAAALEGLDPSGCGETSLAVVVGATNDAILRGARDDLGNSIEALRDLVFGKQTEDLRRKLESVRSTRFDGPEQCAAAIDRGEDDQNRRTM